jgi:hypothetical protein
MFAAVALRAWVIPRSIHSSRRFSTVRSQSWCHCRGRVALNVEES